MLFQNVPIEERIFKGSKYNFLVVGRAEIESFTPEVPYIVISITDPEKEEAKIFDSPFLKDVLRLKFHDVDGTNKFKFAFEKSGDIFMNEDHAREILSFVNKYLPEVSLIVCQCEQGISRSPAIAGALSRILQNEDEYFLKNFWANSWVYNLIIEQSKKTE